MIAEAINYAEIISQLPADSFLIRENVSWEEYEDVTVEVDITRHSISKFGIYAGLGVPEVWIYDGKELKIYLLDQDEYVPATESRALPMLSGPVLTKFLSQLREEGELQAILAFDD